MVSASVFKSRSSSRASVRGTRRLFAQLAFPSVKTDGGVWSQCWLCGRLGEVQHGRSWWDVACLGEQWPRRSRTESSASNFVILFDSKYLDTYCFAPSAMFPHLWSCDFCSSKVAWLSGPCLKNNVIFWVVFLVTKEVLEWTDGLNCVLRWVVQSPVLVRRHWSATSIEKETSSWGQLRRIEGRVVRTGGLLWVHN